MNRRISCVALKNDYHVFSGSDGVQWCKSSVAPPHKKTAHFVFRTILKPVASPVKQCLVASHSEEDTPDEREYFRKSHHWNSVSAGVMRWNPQGLHHSQQCFCWLMLMIRPIRLLVSGEVITNSKSFYATEKSREGQRKR